MLQWKSSYGVILAWHLVARRQLTHLEWKGDAVRTDELGTPQEARGAPWSVLATWLRPGLAAAGIAALAVLGLSMAGGVAELPATFAEVAVAAGVSEVLITAAPGPTPDLLLSAVVEGR